MNNSLIQFTATSFAIMPTFLVETAMKNPFDASFPTVLIKSSDDMGELHAIAEAISKGEVTVEDVIKANELDTKEPSTENPLKDLFNRLAQTKVSSQTANTFDLVNEIFGILSKMKTKGFKLKEDAEEIDITDELKSLLSEVRIDLAKTHKKICEFQKKHC